MARRLRLDFSDLSQKGFAFDTLMLDWQHRGLHSIQTQLRLESPSLELKTTGWVDFSQHEIFQECVAIIPVIDHLLLPFIAAGGLPIAATAYVLDMALGHQLNALTELSWKVSGDLTSPQVSQDYTQ